MSRAYRFCARVFAADNFVRRLLQRQTTIFTDRDLRTERGCPAYERECGTSRRDENAPRPVPSVTPKWPLVRFDTFPPCHRERGAAHLRNRYTVLPHGPAVFARGRKLPVLLV